MTWFLLFRYLQRVAPLVATREVFMQELLRLKGQIEDKEDVRSLAQATIKGLLAFDTAKKVDSIPTQEYLDTLIFGEPGTHLTSISTHLLCLCRGSSPSSAVVFALHQFQMGEPQHAQLQAPIPSNPVTNDDIKGIYNFVGALWGRHGYDSTVIQSLMTYLGQLHVELQGTTLSAANLATSPA